MRKLYKCFQDLKLGDSVFIVNHKLQIESMIVKRLDMKGDELCINYEQGQYENWFDQAGLKLSASWKMKWEKSNYGLKGHLFVLESDARRYCKTQCRAVFDRLYKEAKEKVKAIRDYRAQNLDGLNHLWREEEIEKLERELR